ncbi:MAG: hypothetical protein LBD55_10145, partial [Treponema sp.]|nr:hypothetical protein [Treponema sp.]
PIKKKKKKNNPNQIIITTRGGGGGGAPQAVFCRSFLVKILRFYCNFLMVFLSPSFYQIEFTILKGYEKNV